jgi:hypothetical protein
MPVQPSLRSRVDVLMYERMADVLADYGQQALAAWKVARIAAMFPHAAADGSI